MLPCCKRCRNGGGNYESGEWTGGGPVDILVNNAGIGGSANPKPVVDFDDDFWELSLKVNLTVPYLRCKAALPAMPARKWGRIINVASINGRVPSLTAAAAA